MQMKPTELVELIKEKRPNLLGKMPEKRAVALIRVTLAELGRHIAEAEEGVVRVPPMGTFRIRMVEREKDGENVTVKHIVFLAAKPKE
jgi:hypothetical protein